MYIDKGRSPIQARQECEKLGGHLMRIMSQEEHRFAFELAKASRPSHTWVTIDGSDEQAEGRWLHSNGKPIKYLQWGPGLPSRSREKNHLIFKLHGGGVFSDAAATDSQGFICEWDKEDLKKLAEQTQAAAPAQ
jgi:hypothetical protein